MFKNCDSKQTNQTSRTRIAEIDYLRGIAILAIVLGHAIIIYPINLPETVFWCHALKKFLYSFHLETLFLVAGFCYACSDYLKFIIKKGKHILLPYLIFGGLSLLIHVVGGTVVNGSYSFIQGLKSLLLYGGEYWFLYTIFLMFLIYPLLEKTKIPKLIIIGIFLFLNTSFSFPAIFTLWRFMYFFVFFVIGNLLAGPTMRQKIFNASNQQKFVTLFLCVGFLWLSYFSMQQFGRNNFLRTICALSIIGILAGIALFSSYWTKNKFGKGIASFLKNCSQFSLQLYLFDGYWMTLIRIVICKILKIHAAEIIVPSIWIFNVGFTLLLCNYVLPRFPLLQRACGIVRRK